MHTGIYTCSQLLVPKARASPCVSHASLMRCNTANGLEHFAASRNCHGNAANVPAGFKLAAEGTLLTDIKPRAGTLKGVDNVEANHTARTRPCLPTVRCFHPTYPACVQPCMHARSKTAQSQCGNAEAATKAVCGCETRRRIPRRRRECTPRSGADRPSRGR